MSSDQGALTLHQVKAHDVRAFAASKAFQSGVALEQLSSAYHWRSHHILTQLCLKDVVWGDSQNSSIWVQWWLLSRYTNSLDLGDIHTHACTHTPTPTHRHLLPYLRAGLLKKGGATSICCRQPTYRTDWFKATITLIFEFTCSP